MRAGAALIRTILVLAAAAAACPGARAQDPQPDAAPTKVTVGMFLNSVPSVDLVSNSFKFDAYLWFRWDPAAWPPKLRQPTAPAEDGSGVGDDEAGEEEAGQEAIGPATTFEIIGSDGEVTTIPLYAKPGYCCVQVKGERLNHWDVRSYPFDRQELVLVVEDGSFDMREVAYEPDTQGSGISSELRVTGFRTEAPVAEVRPFSYETSFGDPAVDPARPSRYSRFRFVLPVERESWGLFFKLFTGLFVCAVIAMVALFINATQVDPRFGLCVGGLFGIVGSSYLVSSLLPETSELCYADKLHILGLVVVLVVIVESAFSLSLHLNHGERGAAAAKRLDRATFGVLAVLFAAAATTLTVQAM